jgi:hypothetical protein
MSDEYRGQAPQNVTPWERTVAIYRVARKAGARLRARDLIEPDPEKWWNEWAGPYLGAIERAMHQLLEERIRLREAAMGVEAEQIVREELASGRLTIDEDGDLVHAAPQGEGPRLNN